jgi:hypothetical protein
LCGGLIAYIKPMADKNLEGASIYVTIDGDVHIHTQQESDDPTEVTISGSISPVETEDELDITREQLS